MSGQYDDIIRLPHPDSPKHPRMSLYDRAAQFSPFAALTGHSAAIAETGRLTDRRVELDEYEMARVDAELQHLQELLPSRPTASITYFVPDERKNGGSYQTVTGFPADHGLPPCKGLKAVFCHNPVISLSAFIVPQFLQSFKQLRQFNLQKIRVILIHGLNEQHRPGCKARPMKISQNKI